MKTKPGAGIFRAKPQDELASSRALPDSASSSPNQVSDDSGEVGPESEGSLSISLSHISHIPSSDNDDDVEQTKIDGRWNIPFDDGSFDDLMPRKVPGQENALKDIGGFVPIGKEGRGHSFGGVGTTPVRPVARSAASPYTLAASRGLLRDVTKDKENVSPKRRESPVITHHRGIR